MEECLDLLIFRELDSSRFLIKHFEDSFKSFTQQLTSSLSTNEIISAKKNNEEEKSEHYFVT